MKSKSKPVRKKRVVWRQITIRGYLCPVFSWDHNDPPRMFMPTLTKTRATECDHECVIVVKWKLAN